MGGLSAHARKKKASEIRKDQENLKTSQNYKLAPSLPPKLKAFLILPLLPLLRLPLLILFRKINIFEKQT